MLKSLLLFCCIIHISLCSSSWFPPTDDNTCKFTRQDALQCAMKHGDLNHDGMLDQDEIQHAIKTLIPGYIRVLAWMKGIDLTRVLKDCDYNHDGVLTPRDWELSVKTCMPKQENLCQFKWFCDNV